MTRCFLYWSPVTSFPVPFEQRRWFKKFFDLFLDLLENQRKLRTEVFLTYRAALDFGDSFMKAAQDIPPLMGLSIRPGAGPTRLPSTEEIKKTVEDGKEFNMKDWIGDYCYWFVKKTPRKYIELFGGHGGLRMILLKPDPEAAPPPRKIPPKIRNAKPFQLFDVDALLAGAFALRDGFLPKSKELFGAKFKEEVQFPGIPFILPSLQAEDFFGRSQEEFDKWFQLFDVYVNESPADGGLILASKIDFEADLIGLLEQMRSEGFVYPDGQ